MDLSFISKFPTGSIYEKVGSAPKTYRVSNSDKPVRSPDSCPVKPMLANVIEVTRELVHPTSSQFWPHGSVPSQLGGVFFKTSLRDFRTTSAQLIILFPCCFQDRFRVIIYENFLCHMKIISINCSPPPLSISLLDMQKHSNSVQHVLLQTM